MQFGYKVDGYDVLVINEREARAAAGILFVFGFLSFLNSFMLGNFVFTQYFVVFFMVDFMIRVIDPKFSPSMLVGRVFIQNQTPEYVGAIQKRFAWSIGLALSLPMVYLLVIDPQMTPIKIVICVLCLVLLFSESAFSICLGCKLYNLIFKEKATNCPGGVCEIKQKEPIVQFSGLQKSIVAITLAFSVISLYQFSVNTPNKSMAMNMFSMMDSDIMETTPKVQEDIYDADCVVPQHAIDMGHEKMYKEKFCKKMNGENSNKNSNSKQPSCH